MGTAGDDAAEPRAPGAEDALDGAVEGLRRKRRDLSARYVLSFGQWVLLLAAIAAAIWAGRLGWRVTPDGFQIFLAVLSVVFSLAVALRIAAAGAIMTKPVKGEGWREAPPRYTILCPLRREAASLPRLITALNRLDYPRNLLEIRLIVEADDDEMSSALANIVLPPEFAIVVVPVARPRTKPKALNYALSGATGEFVAVFDAEDVPHREQLRAALDAFADGGPQLGAVQAPLLIDNGAASWLARQFAAEYAIQFLGVVPLLAHFGAPPPLGGTSNHFRRAALDDVGAWDPENVTEDADLGYRLSRFGWRIGVIAPPTWEEAPERLGPWLRQRSRWIKGHLQTWLVLMRNPLRTMSEMGVGAFLAMQLVLGGGLLAAFAHGPLLMWLAALPFLPGHPPVVSIVLVIFGYAAAALAALFAAAQLRDWRLGLAALTMPLYWPLSTFAAVWAVGEIIVRPHHWAKTDHGRSRRMTPE